MQASEAL